MKGLAEMTAENNALVGRARVREAGRLKRLKQRLARFLYDPLKPARFVRRDVNAAIDAWHRAEQKRGGR
jgi:hypothetical protein